MIIYTKSCLPCTHKQRWRDLKQWARQNKVEIEQRDVRRSPEWKLEAERYEIALPFIVNGKQAISLNEPFDRLEEA